jgi:hypothetical protein
MNYPDFVIELGRQRHQKYLAEAEAYRRHRQLNMNKPGLLAHLAQWWQSRQTATPVKPSTNLATRPVRVVK